MILSRRALCALLALSSLALGACSSGRSVMPAAGSLPASHSVAPLSDYVEATVPNVAGTYSGTFTEKQGSQTVNGTVVIKLKQSGSKISGTVLRTIDGSTDTFPFSGTAAKTKKGVSLKFTIFDPNGNATAHGTVIGTHLNGKAYVPPNGSQPAVYITYKTIKQ